MAVEMFSWPNLYERMCRTWGSNSGLLACQAETLPIELPRPTGDYDRSENIHLTQLSNKYVLYNQS